MLPIITQYAADPNAQIRKAFAPVLEGWSTDSLRSVAPNERQPYVDTAQAIEVLQGYLAKLGERVGERADRARAVVTEQLDALVSAKQAFDRIAEPDPKFTRPDAPNRAFRLREDLPVLARFADAYQACAQAQLAFNRGTPGNMRPLRDELDEAEALGPRPPTGAPAAPRSPGGKKDRVPLWALRPPRKSLQRGDNLAPCWTPPKAIDQTTPTSRSSCGM